MQVTKLASIFSSSDAYVFMLVLSFVALIVACFMPKKTIIQKSQSQSLTDFFTLLFMRI